MFTLLPTVQKKRLSREYKLRLATLAVAAVGAVTLIACVLLFPAYVVSNIKARESLLKKQGLESSPLFAEKSALRKTLADVRLELALAQAPEASTTAIIDEVIALKSNGIKLYHFAYTHAPTKGSLILNGKASTRQALLDFKKNLETNPAFSKVDFPVSDLSQSVDIEFTFTISGKL